MSEPQSSEESKQHTIGIPNAIFLMVNATAGAGVLNFPEVYKFTGGFVLATFLVVVFAFLTISGLIVLSMLANDTNTESIQGVVLATGGQTFSVIFIVIILFYGVTSLTTYLIVIGDQLDRVFFSMVNPTFCHRWYLRREFTIIVFSTIFIGPNIFSKKVDFLAHVSKLGLIGIFYITGMVVGFFFSPHYTAGKIGGGPESWNDVTYLIPTFAFAFHCHAQSVPIMASLADRTTRNIIIVSVVNFVICGLMYCSAGIFGYATFGDNVMSNITLNYDAKHPAVVVGLILLCIKICAAYPIVLYVGRTAFIDLYTLIRKTENEEDNTTLRIATALVFHFLSLFFALLVPNIGLIIGFMGMFVALFIFFVPGVGLALESYKEENKEKEWNNSRKVSGIIMAVLGIMLAMFVLVQSIRRIVKSSKDGHERLCVP